MTPRTIQGCFAVIAVIVIIVSFGYFYQPSVEAVDCNDTELDVLVIDEHYDPNLYWPDEVVFMGVHGCEWSIDGNDYDYIMHADTATMQRIQDEWDALIIRVRKEE